MSYAFGKETFEAIIELLLPAMSAKDVDELMQKAEKAQVSNAVPTFLFHHLLVFRL